MEEIEGDGLEDTRIRGINELCVDTYVDAMLLPARKILTKPILVVVWGEGGIGDIDEGLMGLYLGSLKRGFLNLRLCATA